jgi:translation initiation factor IF-3
MKIDPHDVEIRLNQARRFLIDGHKVQVVQNFRGREMAHRDRGENRMQDIIDRLADVSKVEMPPRLAGKRLTMILVPDRAKIEQMRRRDAAAGRGAGEPQAAELPPPEETADDGQQTEAPAAAQAAGR